VFVITRQRKKPALVRTSLRHAFRLPRSSSQSAIPVQSPTGRSAASPAAAQLFGSPAGSATAPPVEAGTGGRSPFRDFSRPGLPHTRNGFAKKKTRKAGRIIPPHVEAVCLIGGYLPKPPNPRWIVYVPDASPHKSPHNPRLHPARKRQPFRRRKTAFCKSARCTIVTQLILRPGRKKTLSAFSKINDCPTIESCPIAPKSPGEPQRTFADQREQRQVCHEPEGIVVVFVDTKTQTCCLLANCFICV